MDVIERKSRAAEISSFNSVDHFIFIEEVILTTVVYIRLL